MAEAPPRKPIKTGHKLDDRLKCVAMLLDLRSQKALSEETYITYLKMIDPPDQAVLMSILEQQWPNEYLIFFS